MGSILIKRGDRIIARITHLEFLLIGKHSISPAFLSINTPRGIKEVERLDHPMNRQILLGEKDPSGAVSDDSANWQLTAGGESSTRDVNNTHLTVIHEPTKRRLPKFLLPKKKE